MRSTLPSQQNTWQRECYVSGFLPQVCPGMNWLVAVSPFHAIVKWVVLQTVFAPMAFVKVDAVICFIKRHLLARLLLLRQTSLLRGLLNRSLFKTLAAFCLDLFFKIFFPPSPLL